MPEVQPRVAQKIERQVTMATDAGAAATERRAVRAGGVAIVAAAVLMAIAGWALQRPDEAAQFDLRDWASYVAQSSEPGLLQVVVQPAPVIVDEQLPQSYWYYCPSAKGSATVTQVPDDYRLSPSAWNQV